MIKDGVLLGFQVRIQALVFGGLGFSLCCFGPGVQDEGHEVSRVQGFQLTEGACVGGFQDFRFRFWGL